MSPYGADHDKLTGLLNWRALEEVARGFFDGVLTPRAVVAVWDIDGLHAINSVIGHAAGDQVIRCVAERLRATIDAAGVVSRYGGDEFAVLLPDMRRGAGKQLLEAAWRTIRAPMEDFGIQVSASCGAVASNAGTDWNSLLRKSDAAMYIAKREKLGVFFPSEDVG